MSQTIESRTKIDTPHEALRIPDSLEQQLLAYRRRVWTIKLLEPIAMALAGAAAAFLIVYFWDRLVGTPTAMRWALLLGAAGLIAMIPWFAYRWVWRHRALEPLARLLSKGLPSVGDRLLGVIELTRSDSEQARSPALCQAAMKQVAEDSRHEDFTRAAPASAYRGWSIAAAILVLTALALAAMYPAASANATARLLAPWRDTPRYTFTRIETLPPEVVVPHGEPAQLAVKLSDASRWQPADAKLTLGGGKVVSAKLRDGGYVFNLPPQLNQQPIELRVGDVIQAGQLNPTLRPELSSVLADVRLPEYLQHPEAQQLDSRGGSITAVKGSEAVFTAIANRELARGEINTETRKPDGDRFISRPVKVDQVGALQFQWQDRFGLTGQKPFDLTVNAVDDEAPTLICDGLPRQAVVLDSETLKFNVRASDDFGVRRVGLMWRGLDRRMQKNRAEGERPLAAGDPKARDLEALATFSAKSLGIEPQPVEVFVWAEDYLPDRERVYSPPHILYVLNPTQHAIWMTEELSKWHRRALDVRDRERQLYEKNKELRDLPPEELNLTDNRRAIERQAAAEKSNGRRLARLGQLGDELVATASKNPEIGVGHLERWAEMLQVLQDLSENRMPSVADLLDQAADQPAQLASNDAKPQSVKSPGGPKAGNARAGGPGTPNEPFEGETPKLRSAPTLVDMESSANSPDDEPGTPGPPKKPSSPSLRLPVTTVMGKNQPKPDAPPETQQESVQEAVEEQEGLLAEFDKLADELNAVLANLEGSTLVKRLKAESRQQNKIAGQLTDQLQPAFGVRTNSVPIKVREDLRDLQGQEQSSVLTVSYIMDDMSAYFERRRFMRFKSTLDEMKETDVVGSLRQLSDEIMKQQGMSVAQCEFWADTLDRWAENLVDPACSGSCPGGKSPESLPPSIVLEVLQILEAEVNLRDETRVADQAKEAVEETEHADQATKLSQTQGEIRDRVANVIDRIGELPDANKHFAKELAMLAEVNGVMNDATDILKRPETGSPAIAAETEAIELLLRSKRINPKGGGGGGASPGGGGGGNTVDSALALIGKGRNEKEVREDRGVTQTTGETGAVLPEEFRRGLDQYFSRLGGS
ncbi:hypothetical protein FYK55_20590 [Roseiconus nitratireducens]|uniref:DUF4175 family protein n=1 Tax=Roseiconus nitratireducens TaxID=2605748 RepID=A0A5M6D5C6_9BACT|nr:hypothetical protein [Roseiconus nitratireducens]KAA5540415.1 hypothetical protein FYK55_20590 [Roseiconus nitratireducens]